MKHSQGACFSCRFQIAKPLKYVVMVVLLVTFMIKAHEALVKYWRGDTLMVSKTLHPEKQTFPSVTLCKADPESDNYTDIPRAVADLKTWAQCRFDHQNM